MREKLDTIEAALFVLLTATVGEMIEYHRRSCGLVVPCFGTLIKGVALMMLCAIAVFPALQQTKENRDMATAAEMNTLAQQSQAGVIRDLANIVEVNENLKKAAKENADLTIKANASLKNLLSKRGE